MTYRPAIVVPVFNHGPAARLTIEGLARNNLPVYLVDDGSDEASAAILKRLAETIPLVRLLRHERNMGKGRAVMGGMRAAFADGCTHVLQIDADGQHAVADVGRFLALSQTSPDRVICGVPIYDASVPRSRLIGRYVTHVWVWIETLSFEIRDSMCGYRVYPLDTTIRLIDEVAIGARMDFDTDILVRLHWRGVQVENLPTRVTYPRGGISHFRLLRDNLRISWAHTRLALGMLPRLPLILARKIGLQ